MTHEELEAEVCRLFGCTGPKFGSSLDGYVIYDAPGGGNIYIDINLTAEQRTELIEFNKRKFSKFLSSANTPSKSG